MQTTATQQQYRQRAERRSLYPGYCLPVVYWYDALWVLLKIYCWLCTLVDWPHLFATNEGAFELWRQLSPKKNMYYAAGLCDCCVDAAKRAATLTQVKHGQRRAIAAPAAAAFPPSFLPSFLP